MLKINYKLFTIYLALILFLNTALAINPGPEYNSVAAENPIPEFYTEVTPQYMKDTIDNLKKVFDGFVFSDIIKNPPSPYNDTKVDVSKLFDGIATDQSRPFYEFYRDIKKALSNLRDANFDFLSKDMEPYHYCLPFKFYLDSKKDSEPKLFIKEYENCSQYYDAETKNFITLHANVSVETINGTDPFDFMQTFFSEFYKFKNPNSEFSLAMEGIHDNELYFTPFSIEQLNYIELNFSNFDTLKTKFHVYKEEGPAKEKESRNPQSNSKTIDWDYVSEGGEVKCKADDDNQLNVFYFNSFYTEKPFTFAIYLCLNIFLDNDYKVVIITSQIWDSSDNLNSFLYAQLLFPKIDIKYNLAMRQSELNKKLFENDTSQFLDAKTCSPYDSWEEFLETNPDD